MSAPGGAGEGGRFAGALPTLEAAVEQHVADGACVWIGNFGCQLFAVGRELARQRRRELHLVVASGGLLLDDLLAAGVAGDGHLRPLLEPGRAAADPQLPARRGSRAPTCAGRS